MTNVDLEFKPPPEAPVFEPTYEEFKEPLAYIAKIRPVAEQTGICKIKPPPDWQPSFAVDVENFKFTPRVQRLNELEATTRIKLNFLDQIAKFWDLQGSSLKIPNIERKILDLYSLHKVVQDEGGLEIVTKERRWSKVASRMGYPPGRSIGSLLRQHYERILYPFDIFHTGTHIESLNIAEETEDCDKRDKDYIPHGIPSRQAIKPPPERYSRRSKRPGKDSSESAENVDYSTNSELRKLQFYGAGPKMPGYSPKYKGEQFDCHQAKVNIFKGKEKYKKVKLNPIDQIVCHTCGRGDAEESMLLCDGCDDSYHTFCLTPPLSEIPKGDWRCPRCVAREVRKPQESFGFEQAQKEYMLQEFGDMADQFKLDYFNMPVHMVPTSAVEKEFWRIVSAVDEDVTVEYGADLHTIEHGSGFPTKNTANLVAGDDDYLKSGWNLNNLPVLEGSVFRHINADISGMKVPWMYVGMCFATFCWHNEDHWSYSINYLHWGEPKTWYGVPGGKAEQFEKAMSAAAPELFHSQPDLLHQLVTIMNPNILMAAGVPVYRTNQQAGEFVVTFPRSYHAGFNQGYNFAEAVNFAPADWLPIGRACISHYSMLHRFCVFSHDELVCKMAADPDRLDISLAAATYHDMLKMVESEKNFRKLVLEWGVTEAEREAFELLPDDERQCDYCKTTCFLSAVTCSCNNSKLVCIAHKDRLCICSASKHCLRYRYTLDELPVMLHRLKVRAESFDNWAIKVKNAMDAGEDEKLDLAELKEFIEEAEEKRFPKTDLLQTLNKAVVDAEKCSVVAQQLLSKKARARTRQSGEVKTAARLSLEELQLFCEQITNLHCEIKEGALIKDLMDRVLDFERNAVSMLEEEMVDSRKLEKLLDVGLNLDIDLPEIPQLRQKVQQCKWLEEVRSSVTGQDSITVDNLRALLDLGVNLPPHASIEKAMAELQELLTASEKWEEKTKLCLQARPRHTLPTLESILAEAGNTPVYLPNVLALKEAVKKAREWSAKVDTVQNREHFPYLDVLESLVAKGRPIPVRLDQLPQMESQVNSAKVWRERTSRTFLKKNSAYTLVEVLSPRKDVGLPPSLKSKKKKLKEAANDKDHERDTSPSLDINLEDVKDSAAIVTAFKQAEQQEIEAMRQLRIKNLRKRAEDMGDARYCVCHKNLTNNMLQCELCKDWFHANCVPLPKSTNIKKQQQQQQQQQQQNSSSSHLSKEMKFLCPLCLRSRRPRLETILSLLVSLQKLPVRLPEGEALQCLTERAMSWQDRARQALATEELAAALAKLSVLSQRMVEQAAREKTEKIISTELMRAANNPDLQPHLQSVAHSAFSGFHNPSDDKGMFNGVSREDGSMTDEMIPAVAAEQEVSASEPVLIMDVETTVEADLENGMLQHDDLKANDADAPSYNNLEHAYSTASKASLNAVPRKHARKSPLVPRMLEAPVLELSNVAKAQLEELMMEGDLLEVSLDETQHIWRILQATKPAKDPLAALDSFSDVEENNVDAPGKLDRNKDKKRLRKRKFDDNKGVNKLKNIKLKEKSKLKALAASTTDGKPKKKLKLNKDVKAAVNAATCHSSSSSSSSTSSSSSSSSEGSKPGLVKKLLKAKSENKDMKEKKDGNVKKEIGEKSFRDKMKLKILEKKQQRKRLREDSGHLHTLSVPSRAEHKSKPSKTDSTSDDEGDDQCSAGKCLRPTGEAVNWVQCDGGCDEWFHLLCVGLKVSDISETEDYICPNCTKKREPLCIKEEENETDSHEPLIVDFEESPIGEEECAQSCTVNETVEIPLGLVTLSQRTEDSCSLQDISDSVELKSELPVSDMVPDISLMEIEPVTGDILLPLTPEDEPHPTEVYG